MSPAWTVRTWAALACGALLISGCGSSSLSSAQLRRRAGRICMTAQRSSASIASAGDPDDAPQFLQRGITALAPQVTALRKLTPSRDLQDGYAAALRASEHELTLLRTTLAGLQAGDDPVVAIKALQSKLDPAEDLTARAWHELGVPACAQVLG